MGGLWRVLNRELVGSDLQLQRWSWVSENGAGAGGEGGGEAGEESGNVKRLLFQSREAMMVLCWKWEC